MALPNPTMNPPRLPSPTKRNQHARSPSRSPVRQYNHARDFDPLLRDLSPTATLRAFSSRPEEARSETLGRSIETASHGERALGAQAAQACMDIRAWAREIRAWEWAGTFDVPEPARKKQRMSTFSIGSHVSRPSIGQAENDAGDELYWGSLNADTVPRYQRRINEITEDLDEIDVEELKDYVLSAHRRAGYGAADVDDSIGAIGADTNLKRLDDFTALITATILQSLPYLSRLHRLLETWTIRLTILRQTSAYLLDLKQARTDLDHGWAALAISSLPEAEDAMKRAGAVFSRETMLEMKGVVEKQVYSLGRRLDGFLDLLEGREECVPERWIEEFEMLEEQYGEWVVQAERKVLEGEWRASAEEHEDGEEVERGIESEAEVFLGTQQRGGAWTSRAAVPGLATTTMTRDASQSETSLDSAIHPMHDGPQRTTVTATTPSDFRSARETSPDLAGPHGSSTSLNYSTKSSSSRRSRHIPIVLDGYYTSNANGDVPMESSAATSPGLCSPLEQLPTPKANDDPETASQIIKKRAALFSGGIEKNEALNKSKPPPIVRPFERASNAFTRLFKRDEHVEEDKSGGGDSRSSSFGAQSLGGGGEKKRSLSSRRTSKSRSSKKAGDAEAKIEYMDMARAPSLRQSENTCRRAGNADMPSKKARDAGPRMEYMDMVRVPQRRSSELKGRSTRPNTRRRSTTGDGQSHSRGSSFGTSKDSSKQNITAVPPVFSADELETRMNDKGKMRDTHRRRDLSSPFHSPMESESGLEVPDNWPLSAEITPVGEARNPTAETLYPEHSGDDTTSPNTAIPTDYFDRMFVHSLPTSPIDHNDYAEDENAYRFDQPSPSKISRPGTATTTEEEVFWNEKPAPDWSVLRTGVSDKESRRLNIRDSNVPRPVSTVLEAEEGVPDTDEEDGRPRDSGTVGYFGASGTSARNMSAKKRTSHARKKSSSTPPVSPVMAKLWIPSADLTGTELASTASSTEREEDIDLVRRASVTSIGSFPRSELKSVDVKRSSIGSFRSPPQSPVELDPGRPSIEEQTSLEMESAATPASYKSEREFPSPTVVSGGGELNATMPKRKYKNVPSPSPRRQKKDPLPLQPGEDNFDRHVSEVLDRVHAPIKFKMRPGAATPQQKAKMPKALGGKNNLTLAPAEPSPKKAMPADPDVKLYHLTQAGRAEPIKLFVRLVGEGERCMVRVGGGWADLADYLRQYAEHHGSRTVSEGVLELQTAAGTGTPGSAKTAAGNTPGNANGVRRAFSGHAPEPKSLAVARMPVTPAGSGSTERPRTKDGQRLRLSVESQRDRTEASDEEVSPTLAHSRLSPPGSQRSTTGRSPSSGSRPSTASSPGATAGLGMAGPRMKADLLPEQKARWVEGMIERVNKSASAEKEQQQKFLGDMGKVGSTRRMVFRTGTGDGGRE
ncbi:hypothetical protein LTR37_018381 [Vermiconidia calcicola]|uniref:Uncharacterized protein n=1 Tax=Vermiconidia calcicola TaxID=1690605 RepID=A0ACC3MHA5_9PEZI|nr:hypothetical protein LTR37_018381 [Vermiconidia calcicola]